QLVHLEPVERARLDGLDQVGRLDSRLLERVAADERGTLERDVVELATARMVRADRADERALAQPLAAQDRVARARDRHDHVLLGRLLIGLTPVGSDTLAERLQRRLGPA